jgi:hypothetical protein
MNMVGTLMTLLYLLADRCSVTDHCRGGSANAGNLWRHWADYPTSWWQVAIMWSVKASGGECSSFRQGRTTRAISTGFEVRAQAMAPNSRKIRRNRSNTNTLLVACCSHTCVDQCRSLRRSLLLIRKLFLACKSFYYSQESHGLPGTRKSSVQDRQSQRRVA